MELGAALSLVYALGLSNRCPVWFMIFEFFRYSFVGSFRYWLKSVDGCFVILFCAPSRAADG